MPWGVSRELFLRFFAPALLPALTLLLPPPLLPLLLLATGLASVAEEEESLTRKGLAPERDLRGLLEPGVEGSEEEWAEGIWGDDEDTCLDELLLPL